MRTWIKLYTEILRDPKMGRLTDREYRTCVNLFLLAGAIDEDGRLGSTEDIAWQLRMTEENTAADLVVLRDLGIIALNGDVGEEWHVTHFEKRQARPPSAEPEAVTERVQRYRANLKRGCNEDVTSLQRGETPSEADPDPDQIQIRSRQASDPEQTPTKSQNLHDDDASPDALALLLAMPMNEPNASRVATAGLDYVQGWLDEFNRRTLAGHPPNNPPGLLYSFWEAGSSPPARAGPNDGNRRDRLRFIEGEYASIIEH